MPLASTLPNTDRKAHYGTGRQPWDDILDLGWAPEFAASNVLKYLRRSKDPEHSQESALWYLDKLKLLAEGHGDDNIHARDVLNQLLGVLTIEELETMKKAAESKKATPAVKAKAAAPATKAKPAVKAKGK